MAADAAQEWPPKQGDEAVLELASDWALSNGLVLRPPTSSTDDAAYTRPGQSVIHAPYALYPSAFPRKLFQQAIDLQAAYNRLYADVTVDDAFLDQVIGGAVSKVDEFQGRLYDIWKQVKKEGIRQVRPPPLPSRWRNFQVSLTRNNLRLRSRSHSDCSDPITSCMRPQTSRRASTPSSRSSSTPSRPRSPRSRLASENCTGA